MGKREGDQSGSMKRKGWIPQLCTNQQPPQRGGAVPVTPGTPPLPCGRSRKNCLLFPLFYQAAMGPPTLVSPGERRGLMSWRNRERYSCPLQSLVVSLLSLVSTVVFSRTGGALSHRNSSTRRFARFPPRNLCSLVTLAVFSLVYAATDTAYCLALISVGLAESRILPATPVDTRP